MNRKLTLGLTLALILALAVSMAAMADGTPTISAEFPEYSPNETVNLNGAGWQAQEAVHVFVNDNVGQSWSYAADVVAGDDGSFVVSFQLPSWFVATYFVTATGSSGAVATTTFADGNAIVTGKVTDAANDPIPGAAVTCDPSSGCNGTYTAMTNGSGQYFFDGSGLSGHTVRLQFSGTSATLTLSASKTGYTATTQTRTVVNGQSVANVDFVLALLPPSDSTPPVISYTLNPAAADGSNGWYKGNVTLTWSVSEPDSPSSLTKSGCVNQNITADQAATDYSCSATSDGGSAGPITVTIKRDATAPSSITWTGGIANGASFAYGSVPAAPTCSATDTPSGMDKCVVSGYATSLGSHTLTAAALDLAGNSATATRTYTVTQKALTASIAADDKPYDGDTDASFTCSLSGVVGTDDVHCAGGSASFANKNVGTWTVTATGLGLAGADKGNYTLSNTTATDTADITKADATCSISGYTGAYDAASHGASGSCSGIGTENAGTLNLGASFTNVPGGTAHWVFTGNGNYKDQSGDVSIAISKADASCSVTGYTGVYDAALHGASGSCSGIGGESAGTLNLGATFTDVPGGTANWAFTGNGNYNDQSGAVSIAISKANATCSISGYTGVYDGNAHGASGSCLGVKGETLSGLNLGAGFTNAPGGTAHWAFTDVTGNYNDANGTAAISISKANATCSLGGYTGVYDGDAHGASGSCTGVKDEELAGLDLGASFTNVPGGTANWAFTDVTGNYIDESGSVEIAISKAAATCTITPYTGVYDSASHGATGSCTGVKSEPLSGLDLGASFTNVPGGTANWVFTDVTGNYIDESGSVVIAISKADATCTISGYTDVYDSASHGATGSCLGVKGETLAGVDLGASFTNVPGGTANWVFTDVTGNYIDESGSVEIAISKAAATCTITPYTAVYDHAAHTATGSCNGVGTDSTLSGLDLSATTHTNPGVYSDPWAFSGGTNYKDQNGTLTDKITFATGGQCYGAPGHTILQPINADGSSVWKARNTVPVKFRVCDAFGVPVSDMALVFSLTALHTQAVPYLYQVSSGVLAIDESAASNTPDPLFRWSASDQQWIFNLNTNSLSAGKTYYYHIYLADGTMIDFRFGLK